MSIGLAEMEARMQAFIVDHCRRRAKPSLRLLSDMYWVLGLEPQVRLVPRPTRIAVAEDFGLPLEMWGGPDA